MSTSKKIAITSDATKRVAAKRDSLKSVSRKVYQAPAMKKMQKLSQVTGGLKVTGNVPG